MSKVTSKRHMLSCAFAMFLLSAVAGCSGGGAAVVPSPTGDPGSAACHNDWDEAEARDRNGEFHPGRSCDQLGFTKHCPADDENAYRQPGYDC